MFICLGGHGHATISEPMQHSMSGQAISVTNYHIDVENVITLTHKNVNQSSLISNVDKILIA